MKKTLIAGLVAFSLVATAGIAMAGQSQIKIETFSTYGGLWEWIIISPDYMNDELMYQSFVDIPFGENVGTMAWTAVPEGPSGEEDPDPTIFGQYVEADELYVDGYYWDMMTVEGVAGDEDDVFHMTELYAYSIGDPYGVYPTVSRDLEVTTGWISDAENFLYYDQDIYVDEIADDWADAYGELYSINMYGDGDDGYDYIFELEQWGSTMDFELDWIIGPPPSNGS